MKAPLHCALEKNKIPLYTYIHVQNKMKKIVFPNLEKEILYQEA